MISERLKEFSQVSWCPPTMIVPAQDSNNAKGFVNVDLSQWMSKVQVCNCAMLNMIPLKERSFCKDGRLLKCKDGRNKK